MRLLALLIFLPCAAMAQDFPLTMEGRFGPVTIAEKPERVATIGYAGGDDLLALGIQPVALRYWYGDQAGALWPWAAPLLQAEPEVLRGEINYEQIAASDPDVIIALWSGIGQADHDRLSRIAPVVAGPPGLGEFELPWDMRARLTGRAVGKEAEAEEQIAGITAALARIAADHPGWQGKTATVAQAWTGQPGGYTSNDLRARIMEQMGFVTPEALNDAALGAEAFTVQLSEETLKTLDADLILWLSQDGGFDAVEALVTRPFLNATRAGHEVFVGELLAGALSHASLLSLPYALDGLEPAIEQAMRGEGPARTE